MEAHKTASGDYRVSWKQALRLSNFTTVTDPDTGRPLTADKRTLGILGGFSGGAIAVTIMMNFLLWLFVFDESYGFLIALVTCVLVLSIYLATAVASSQMVTFTKTDADEHRVS